MDVHTALPEMQALAARIWSPESRHHPGQLSWSVFYAEDLAPGPVELARVAGEVVGWTWAESEGWLEICVDPAHPAVASHLIGELAAQAPEAGLTTMVLETEEHLLGPLRAAGFVAGDQPWFTHHTLALDDRMPVPGIEGYTFRHVRPDEADARAACHRDAWSDVGPSRVTATAYDALMRAPYYRHDLDWVAVDRDGRMVASAASGSTPRTAWLWSSRSDVRRTTGAEDVPVPSVSRPCTPPGPSVPRPPWSARAATPTTPPLRVSTAGSASPPAVALSPSAVPPDGHGAEYRDEHHVRRRSRDDTHPDHVHPRCGGARRATRGLDVRRPGGRPVDRTGPRPPRNGDRDPSRVVPGAGGAQVRHERHAPGPALRDRGHVVTRLVLRAGGALVMAALLVGPTAQAQAPPGAPGATSHQVGPAYGYQGNEWLAMGRTCAAGVPAL
jgi:hypothetical protein